MTFKQRVTDERPEVLDDIYPAGVKGCPHDYDYEESPRDEYGNCPRHMSCDDCWNREMPEGNLPKVRMTNLHGVMKRDKETVEPRIKDSGERRQFESGAVRDIQEGKGRCDLMPLDIVAEFLRLYADQETASPIEAIAKFQEDGDTRHLYDALYMFNMHRAGWGLSHAHMFLEVAKHFEEGAKKYGENNWQKGLPVKCYIDSAVRHYLKWMRGDKDEPHDRAFVWNLMCCIWEVDYSPRAKELKSIITPVKVIPNDMVRYGDCPVGLFETDEGVFVKTEIEHGVYIAVHVNTGRSRLVDNDILVRPIDSPFTDERYGDD